MGLERAPLLLFAGWLLEVVPTENRPAGIKNLPNIFAGTNLYQVNNFLREEEAGSCNFLHTRCVFQSPVEKVLLI